MKLLMLGATGFLGSTLFHLAERKNIQVVGSSRYLNENENIIELDVTNKHALKSTLESYDPDAVVWTLLSRENEDVLIDYGITNLLSVIKRETKLIFFSTDAVFTSGKGGYKEADKPIPLPVNAPLATYVNAKIRAERKITESHKNHTIIRTGPLYGMDANGNIEARTQKMIRQLKEKGSVEAYADLYKTFVHIEDLSNVILEIAFQDFKGTIHLGPLEKESYFNFHKKRIDSLGFNSSGIKPITLADGEESYLPLDTSLDTRKANNILKYHFRRLYA